MADEEDIEGAETDADGGEGEAFDAQRALVAQSLEVSKLKQHIEVLKRANERIREQYKQEVRTLLQPLIEKHRKLQSENGKLLEKVELYQVAPAGTDEAVVEELRKLRHDHAVLQKISEGLEADSRLARRLQAELEEAQGQIATLEAKVNELEREKRRLESMVAERDHTQIELEEKLETSQTQGTDWREKYEKAIKDHKDELKDYQMQLGEAVRKLTNLERQHVDATMAPEVLPALFEELQAELATYDDLASLLTSAEPLPESLAASLAFEEAEIAASIALQERTAGEGITVGERAAPFDTGAFAGEALSLDDDLSLGADPLPLDDLTLDEAMSLAFPDETFGESFADPGPAQPELAAWGEAPAVSGDSLALDASLELSDDVAELGGDWQPQDVADPLALDDEQTAWQPQSTESTWEAAPMAADSPDDWLQGLADPVAEAVPETSEAPQTWDLDAAMEAVPQPWESEASPTAAVNDDAALGWDQPQPSADDISLAWEQPQAVEPETLPGWETPQAGSDDETHLWEQPQAIAEELSLGWEEPQAVAEEAAPSWEQPQAVAEAETLGWEQPQSAGDQPAESHVAVVWGDEAAETQPESSETASWQQPAPPAAKGPSWLDENAAPAPPPTRSAPKGPAPSWLDENAAPAPSPARPAAAAQGPAPSWLSGESKPETPPSAPVQRGSAPSWLNDAPEAAPSAAHVAQPQEAPSWGAEAGDESGDFSSQLAQSLGGLEEGDADDVELIWETGAEPETAAAIEFAPGALASPATDDGSWANAISADIEGQRPKAKTFADDEDEIERLAYGATDDDTPNFRMEPPTL